MGAIDTAILFAYLGLMIGLGIYANYKQKDIDDYFVVGSSSRTFEYGISGVWYITPWLWAVMRQGRQHPAL